MDFEKGLIAATLRDGYDAFLASNCDSKWLTKDCAKVVDYIDKYFRKYARTPSFETIERMTGASFQDAPEDSIGFWVDQIRNKYVYESMSGLMDTAREAAQSDPLKAHQELMGGLIDVFESSSSDVQLVPVLSADLWQRDLESLLVEDGIPTFAPSLTERTGGWQPQDLIVLAARPGKGKTFMLLLQLLEIWKARKRVLFVTTEMSMRAIRLRTAALATKTNYGRIRRGLITDMEKKYINLLLQEWDNNGLAEQFVMMGDSMSVTIENIEAKIATFKPHVVAIDGVYLIRSAMVKERDRFKRIAEIFDQLKSMAKRRNVALIVTTQMNRAKDGGGTDTQKGNVDRMAFSDNIGMVADYIVFLHREAVEERAMMMEVVFGKMREADNYDPIFLNWDFDRHDFSEMSKDEAQSRKTEAEVELAKESGKHGPGSINAAPPKTPRSKKAGSGTGTDFDARAAQVKD